MCEYWELHFFSWCLGWYFVIYIWIHKSTYFCRSMNSEIQKAKIFLSTALLGCVISTKNFKILKSKQWEVLIYKIFTPNNSFTSLFITYILAVRFTIAPMEIFNSILFKGTLSVIKSDPLCIHGIAWFTTVPFKALSYELWLSCL